MGEKKKNMAGYISMKLVQKWRHRLVRLLVSSSLLILALFFFSFFGSSRRNVHGRVGSSQDMNSQIRDVEQQSCWWYKCDDKFNSKRVSLTEIKITDVKYKKLCDVWEKWEKIKTAWVLKHDCKKSMQRTVTTLFKFIENDYVFISIEFK